MKIRIIFVVMSFLVSIAQAAAQKRGVIVNMADGVPVRDVKIFTNTNKVATTNWRGEYYIPSYFTSVTISHPDYIALTLNLYEMNDTIEILPKAHTLNEVVIYGQRRTMFDPKKATKDARDYYTPHSGFSFDFFDLFRKKGLSKKEKKRHDEIIRTY